MNTLTIIMTALWVLVGFGLVSAGGSTAPISAQFAVIFMFWGLLVCWMTHKFIK